jgi:hypothetical protein
VAKLEIKEKVNWNIGYKVTNAIEGTRGQGKIMKCNRNGKEGIKEKDTELDKSSIKDEINEEG